MAEDINYWQLDKDKIVKLLKTDLVTGLSSREIKDRLDKYGYNQLEEAKGRSPVGIFLDQFKDFIVWVLVSAALVSGFLKEWIDAFVIILIVILNAILGFVQEYRAEKSLQALKKLSSPNSKAIRDGKNCVIPSKELVPGDLIELEAGDNVPADSRIVWLTSNFAVQEASLTGESTPSSKTSIALEEKDVPLADRANMIYMGTFVSAGKARAIVVETGMKTELGKIAGMIQSIEDESTPLQKKLDEFGKWIVYICFILVGIIFLIGLLRGGKVLDLFLTAVSLAVAAIPEGLPAIVTISLALGVQRMVKRHALIRKLPSVETLGSATVICSDKTGTLTKNEMTVQMVFADDKLFKVSGIGYEPTGNLSLEDTQINASDFPGLNKTLLSGVLCNGAQLTKVNDIYKIIGDPTEGAILTLAGKANIWKKEKEEEYPFVDEIPFDSERKKMTVIRRTDHKYFAFVKGAPDVLINGCAYIENSSKVGLLTKEGREKIDRINNELAGKAMRVLGIAYKVLETLPPKIDAKSIEKDMIFLGLAAMIDPARPEVKKAMEECKDAGIKTVMITGDHKNTAVAIAKELGFFNEDSIALTGEELDKLSEEEFSKKVRNISVYARVSPEHKLRIVRAWKKLKEIVAMTGDGVNDAPAVKEADIGVAMGITGTDVTKEVASMIVTDDNFASIVAAVEEGRGIYDNIKKFILYLLSCNAGEIFVMFIASVSGLPIPLLPIHILWVNLVTDGLPAFALGVDPANPNIMKRPPLAANESIVNKERAITMVLQGLFIALCSLSTFIFLLYVAKGSLIYARTGAFIVLSCSQLFHSFNCRSTTRSIFEMGIFTNSKLVLAAIISFLLQMMVVYIPFFDKIFKTEQLSMTHLGLVILISSFPLWAMEIVKFIKRKK
ncbi:MAG: calcium-transporting P-type ATPase, PMR1-type [bacterium]|nr:calcium-transporting P-type ATPase, PMR1-type [bacterium]